MKTMIESHITAIKLTVKAEMQNCLQASIHNDGTIDKKEKRLLKRLTRASRRYIRELEKIT